MLILFAAFLFLSSELNSGSKLKRWKFTNINFFVLNISYYLALLVRFSDIDKSIFRSFHPARFAKLPHNRIINKERSWIIVLNYGKTNLTVLRSHCCPTSKVVLSADNEKGLSWNTCLNCTTLLYKRRLLAIFVFTSAFRVSSRWYIKQRKLMTLPVDKR